MLTGILAASSVEVFDAPPVGLLPSYAEEHKELLENLDLQALILDLMSARMADDMDSMILGLPSLTSEQWMEARGEKILEEHLDSSRKGITVNTLEVRASMAPLPYGVLAGE